jgi:hypothetical protein
MADAAKGAGMSQNTSHAVMQQRHEAHDSLDHFPTPPWATRALCLEFRLAHGRDFLDGKSVWEPACGEGCMARPLAEYFGHVFASDIHRHGFGQEHDFLMPYFPDGLPFTKIDWIITNPPFRLAAEFVHRAVDIARVGVAMLVRTSFLEGIDRHANLFSRLPPWAVLQFVERVPMVKGRLDRNASTATSYCWIVWRTDLAVSETRMMWIPPSRRVLEHVGDYPE